MNEIISFILGCVFTIVLTLFIYAIIDARDEIKEDVYEKD